MVQINPCCLPKPVKSWDSLAEVLSLHRKHVPLTTQSIPQDYRYFVEGLRHISCSSFTVNSTAVPVQHISRRIPVALQNEVKAKLTDLETKGIIKKETAPTDWISNTVVVAKPRKTRICLSQLPFEVLTKTFGFCATPEGPGSQRCQVHLGKAARQSFQGSKETSYQPPCSRILRLQCSAMPAKRD